MPSKDQYQSPLVSRYASKQMSQIFSEQNRYKTFRRLWLELARREKQLGLPITDEQITEMEMHLEDIDFSKVHDYEKKYQHDVMAHIHAFADVCPTARPIIHLGATSCYVTDNADLISMKDAIKLILAKLLSILHVLSNFAEKEAKTACVGYTHFQPAQPTTVGKRACLWLQDCLMDFLQGEELFHRLPFLGIKGASGTQASFLHLFNEDQKKACQLDQDIAKAFGFENVLIISSQTYSRKIDVKVLQFLENLAISFHKCATDIRLLSHVGEIREKFGEKQVGSSAMPYKKNPIYSERICSLARFLISLSQNPSYTAATQWLERSLDDSANRRISIPEAFLTADGLCNIFHHLIENLYIDRKKIHENIQKHLPYLSMENILMIAVKKGGDRQKVHEKLRTLANKDPTHFFEDIQKDKDLKLSIEEIEKARQEKQLIGRSSEQVLEFIQKEVHPVIQRSKDFQTEIPKVEI